MKTQKSKIIVLAVLLTSFLSIGSNAEAQVFGLDLAGGAKKIIKDARAVAVVSTPSTSNSIIQVNGSVSPSIKWVMVAITKGDFKEVVTFAATNGAYETNLSLRAGAGLYQLQFFQNAEENRYTSYSYLKTSKVQNNDERDTSFLLPSQNVQSDDQRIIDLEKQLTAGATTDLEAITAIHDYVAQTVQYDFASYRDGSYINKSYDAVTVLEQPVTVCSGYSNLFAALLRAHGFRVKVIHGKGFTRSSWESHAWNEVYLNNEWRSIDSTWDSNLSNKKYFLIDEEVFKKDHLKEKELTDY